MHQHQQGDQRRVDAPQRREGLLVEHRGERQPHQVEHFEPHDRRIAGDQRRTDDGHDVQHDPDGALRELHLVLQGVRVLYDAHPVRDHREPQVRRDDGPDHEEGDDAQTRALRFEHQHGERNQGRKYRQREQDIDHGGHVLRLWPDVPREPRPHEGLGELVQRRQQRQDGERQLPGMTQSRTLALCPQETVATLVEDLGMDRPRVRAGIRRGVRAAPAGPAPRLPGVGPSTGAPAPCSRRSRPA